MQRYNIAGSNRIYELEIDEDPDGDWVKYEDMMTMLEKRESILKNLEHDVHIALRKFFKSIQEHNQELITNA
jgi:hypothetical protein